MLVHQCPVIMDMEDQICPIWLMEVKIWALVVLTWVVIWGQEIIKYMGMETLVWEE